MIQEQGRSWIDLRSDTVTHPTPAMREAMATAAVGDDVAGEDPSVQELEAYTAELLGKQQALFVPSGTFANQCAIATLTRPGNEVVLSERCHILAHEAGAAPRLSGVQLRPAGPQSPHLQARDLESRWRNKKNVHFPETGLVCVEQATSDGTLTPLEELQAIYSASRERKIPVYMDGARLFNAAEAMGLAPKALASAADVVGVCLSKGLAAPVGSLLAGSAAFIAEARFTRKIMGGGMRQAGVLAAPGLLALKDRSGLAKDHANARRLAEGLAGLGIKVLREPEINLVFARIEAYANEGERFVSLMRERGVKVYPPEEGVFRFVTHRGTASEDVDQFLEILGTALAVPKR